MYIFRGTPYFSNQLTLVTRLMKKISFVSSHNCPKGFGHNGLGHDIAIFWNHQTSSVALTPPKNESMVPNHLVK